MWRCGPRCQRQRVGVFPRLSVLPGVVPVPSVVPVPGAALLPVGPVVVLGLVPLGVEGIPVARLSLLLWPGPELLNLPVAVPPGLPLHGPPVHPAAPTR